MVKRLVVFSFGRQDSEPNIKSTINFIGSYLRGASGNEVMDRVYVAHVILPETAKKNNSLTSV